MRRVTGIGGVFFKADDPEKLYRWYQEHLGIEHDAGGAAFHWRDEQNPERHGMTAWAIFNRHSQYFDPSRAQAMINYRVDDLDRLLDALRAEGVEVDPKREDYEYGRFAWIMDPEGNKIELWEPPKADR
jgi:predicted enzyme related to lactoylglutathione lyase